MSTITQISNLFNLMVQQPNSGLKFYHFGWRSDINRNIDNNFDQGTETGRLFPALQFHVPEYTELKDGEKLQFDGYGEKMQITLWFDDLQDYENDGEENTDNLIEQWQKLKKVADVFIINFNEIFSNYYKAGYLEDNIRFVPRSNLHNDRLITWEVSFDLVHVADCVDILDRIDTSQFPATFEDISIIDIENYNPATPPTRCDLILQQLSDDDLLNCILPTYNFADPATQEATTEQQQTDLKDWLCTGPAPPPPSSMQFDGVNESIRVKSDSSLDFEYNTPFTLSCYVKLGSVNFHNLMNKGDFSQTEHFIGGLVLNDNKVRFALYNDITFPYKAIIINTNTILSLNTWYRLDFVYKGIPTAENAEIWINGVRDTTNVIANNLGNNTISNPNTFWRLGSAADSLNPLDGLLHEVKIYNIALSGSDISTDNANVLAFNNGTVSSYTPVQSANLPFRNATGSGAVFGALDWVFPDEGTGIGSQSVLMEEADKNSDIPLIL